MSAMSEGEVIRTGSYHLILRSLAILIPDVAETERVKLLPIRVHVIVAMPRSGCR